MGETHRLTQEGQKKENSSGSVILVYDYRCIYDVVNKNKIVYSNRNRLTCTTWSVWYPNNKHSKGAGKNAGFQRIEESTKPIFTPPPGQHNAPPPRGGPRHDGR